MNNYPASTTTIEDQQPSLEELLVEFERNITWEAVDAAWRDRRNGWTQDVHLASNPVRLGELLVELETHVKWEDVDASWRNRRSGWIRAVLASG